MSYDKEILYYTFQNLFYFKYHENVISVEEIIPDSSNRKIFRLKSEHKNCIGIYYEGINENKAFIEFSKTLKRIGLNVPEFYCVSTDNKYYIIEDLGSMDLFSFSRQKYIKRDELIWFYKKALKDLTEFQTRAADELDFDLCYQTKKLDRNQFEYDLIKFQEYYLKKFFISQDESLINNAFEEILSKVPDNKDEYFVYRDFQPRNILVKSGELYYIDYQSGRLGPLEYDPASFLYSSSIFINENDRKELLGYYLKELSKKIDIDTETFFENFYYFALLRLLQVLGSYGYNFDRKKNSDILFKIPRALNNIESIITQFENKYILKFLMSLLDPENSVRLN
ncbi:MAG: phosphotransferase [Ignavibacteria bacterium]|nr:phosphotransferase [Ignavibacteria bacterium]